MKIIESHLRAFACLELKEEELHQHIATEQLINQKNFTNAIFVKKSLDAKITSCVTEEHIKQKLLIIIIN
jgi:hypothetical protein